MAYRIELTGAAELDANSSFEYIRETSPVLAKRWFEGLFQAINSLRDMPQRCPIIVEADELRLEARHLLYGKRSGIYRILFIVIEDSIEEPTVRVLRIWHGARDAVTAKDFLV